MKLLLIILIITGCSSHKQNIIFSPVKDKFEKVTIIGSANIRFDGKNRSEIERIAKQRAEQNLKTFQKNNCYEENHSGNGNVKFMSDGSIEYHIIVKKSELKKKDCD